MWTLVVVAFVSILLGVLAGWAVHAIVFPPAPDDPVEALPQPDRLHPPAPAAPSPVARPAPPAYPVRLMDRSGGQPIRDLTIPRRSFRIFHAGLAWDHYDTAADGRWLYCPTDRLSRLQRRALERFPSA